MSAGVLSLCNFGPSYGQLHFVISALKPYILILGSFLLHFLQPFCSCPLPERAPARVFLSLSGLHMKLLAFVRLSEAEREVEGERGLLVEQDGCICNSSPITYTDCVVD